MPIPLLCVITQLKRELEQVICLIQGCGKDRCLRKASPHVNIAEPTKPHACKKGREKPPAMIVRIMPNMATQKCILAN